MVDFRKWRPSEASLVQQLQILESVPAPKLKIDDGTPKGWVKVTAYTNGERIVVEGSPMDDDGDEENGHNCDQMGCGFAHVLAIADIPEWQRRQLRRGYSIAPEVTP